MKAALWTQPYLFKTVQNIAFQLWRHLSLAHSLGEQVARVAVLRRRVIALTSTGLSAPSVLRAQNAWPERPVKLMVPWPPGGSTSTIANVFVPKLAEALGKPVEVEHRAGSGPGARPGPAPRQPSLASSVISALSTRDTGQLALAASASFWNSSAPHPGTSA